MGLALTFDTMLFLDTDRINQEIVSAKRIINADFSPRALLAWDPELEFTPTSEICPISSCSSKNLLFLNRVAYLSS